MHRARIAHIASHRIASHRIGIRACNCPASSLHFSSHRWFWVQLGAHRNTIEGEMGQLLARIQGDVDVSLMTAARARARDGHRQGRAEIR